MENNERKNKKGGGKKVGEWLVTFNDLMTLLLTFFVLLLAMGSLEGGKTRLRYTQFREGIGPLGFGRPEEYSVFEPFIPVMKMGRRSKIVQNLYRLPELTEPLPAAESLRKGKARPNVVVRPIRDVQEMIREQEGMPEERSPKPPPLPPEQLEKKNVRMGIQDLSQAHPELRYEVRDENTLAVSIPQLFLFETGQSALKASAHRLLDRIAAFLSKHPDLDVTVEGYTDDTPVHTREFPSNWELSVSRAAQVMNELQEKSGLPARSFSVAGYGDTRPVAPNDTQANRTRNRRVEIVLSYKY